MGRSTIRLILVAGAMILAGSSGVFAQRLAGTVKGENGEGLPDVNVTIPALQIGAATDREGAYVILRVPPGTYAVEYYSIGFERESRTVTLPGPDSVTDVTLHESPLELPAITVTAKPQPSDILNSAQPISTIEDRRLEKERGQSIVKSMELMPGMSVVSNGPLNMKPVIRGLTAQRIVVLENGVRHEAQQWDDVQSPEIDALDVERLEVMRGPNSVLYGSDALGGVVNIITDEMDVPREDGSALGGEFTANGFSNNRQAAGGLTLLGSRGEINYKAHLTKREAGDISTPEGSLFNSGARELHGKASVGFKPAWGRMSLTYAHFNQKLQVHPDPAEIPVLTPFQNITHDKVHATSVIPLQSVRLELHGTWQRNIEREFVDGGGTWTEYKPPDEHLVLNTLIFDSKLHHTLSGKTFGTVGASVMDQANESRGLEPLIPSYHQLNLAGYVYEETRLAPLTLSAGLRYDTRSLQVDENAALFVSAQTRTYNALTGTAGVVWHVSAPVALSANIGRGWRSPIPEELFVEGYEPGSVRYKVGEPELEPEESLNLDLIGRYVSPRLTAELSFFHNRINRYIYLAKTDLVDSASGLTIYRHRQTNATLLGTELDAEGVITRNLVVHGGIDIVLGRNEETGDWLPLVPAQRIKAGVRASGDAFSVLRNPYVSLGTKIVFDQNRVDEFEPPTAGYATFDASFGAEIPMRTESVEIDCSLENLFNRAYADHLSRFREYALDPGFNLTLRVAVPFTLIN